MNIAAVLSMGRFAEPHFGEWTQDGQPDSQVHPWMAFRVCASK
jgi:hypothetical protein